MRLLKNKQTIFFYGEEVSVTKCRESFGLKTHIPHQIIHFAWSERGEDPRRLDQEDIAKSQAVKIFFFFSSSFEILILGDIISI